MIVRFYLFGSSLCQSEEALGVVYRLQQYVHELQRIDVSQHSFIGSGLFSPIGDFACNKLSPCLKLLWLIEVELFRLLLLILLGRNLLIGFWIFDVLVHMERVHSDSGSSNKTNTGVRALCISLYLQRLLWLVLVEWLLLDRTHFGLAIANRALDPLCRLAFVRHQLSGGNNL